MKVHLIERIQPLASGWSEWTCEVEREDGTVVFGSIQSDGHSHAEETFEEIGMP